LWESTLAGLRSLVALGVRYLDTPFLLISYVFHVVYPDANCAFTTCRTRYDRDVVGFAKRLWTRLSRFVLAPCHLSQKLSRRLFPPPCNHNRCKSRIYISPPSPPSHRLKALHDAIHTRLKNLTAPQPPAFPFLKLPVELGYQIYSYARIANTSHTIQRPSPGTSENRAQHALYHRTHHAVYHTVTSAITATPEEDNISYA
jgi:hypothetical protein